MSMERKRGRDSPWTLFGKSKSELVAPVLLGVTWSGRFRKIKRRGDSPEGEGKDRLRAVLGFLILTLDLQDLITEVGSDVVLTVCGQHQTQTAEQNYKKDWMFTQHVSYMYSTCILYLYCTCIHICNFFMYI